MTPDAGVGMTPLAAVLVLISAGLHTGWNLLLKQSGDKLVASCWFMWGCAALGTVPAVALMAAGHGPPPAAVGLAFITSVLWLFYYALMSRGYETGDLSVVYPILRGVSPMLAAAMGWALGERPTASGAVGVALVTAAVWAIASPGRGHARPARASVLCAAAAATLSAIYTGVDKVGVQLSHPVVYVWLTCAMTSVWLGAYTLRLRGAAVWAEARRTPWLMAGGAAGDYISWLLILVALQSAHVMYVVPLRAVAVLLSVLAGRLALGEPDVRRRLLAGLIMVVGIALIVWTG